MLHALQTRRVNRAFDARPRPGALRAMRAHLAECAACRRRYERQLVAEAALPDGPDRAGERLWREIRALAEEPAPRPARRWTFSLALAAAAVAALFFLPRALHRDEGFVARGGGATAALPPALHVFHAVGGTAAEPVVDRMHASDGLLFAYSNPGPAYSHLMVFAVDEQRRVYWFYPAYQVAGEDPEAIRIEPGRSGVELAEEIRHPFGTGAVRLFALFLPRSERVLAVEEAVARAYPPGVSIRQELPLGVAGAHQESRLLEVGP